MIFGIGTDMIEVARVREKVKKEDFKKRLFSEREIALCESKGRPAESFAARFAGKEAFLKALGTGWDGQTTFTDIEILNNEMGKPELILSGRTKVYFDKLKLGKIHVTLSHLKDLAMAVVLIEATEI